MNRFANLPHARSPHTAVLCRELEHARLPRNTEKSAHLFERLLRPIDELFVLHLEDLLWKQRLPLAHQLTTPAQMMCNVTEIGREGKLSRVELLEEDRQTGVERIALHHDESCFGKQAAQQTDVTPRIRSLVDHPAGAK